MGDKVQNHMQIREGNRFGFATGQSRGPHGPSLSTAPDGMPWTFHHASPTVAEPEWLRIVAAARGAGSAWEWIERVEDVDPDMARWLRLLPEPARMWAEARS